MVVQNLPLLKWNCPGIAFYAPDGEALRDLLPFQKELSPHARLCTEEEGVEGPKPLPGQHSGQRQSRTGTLKEGWTWVKVSPMLQAPLT